MKNILKVIFVIIGTLIGAGFASGKEIYIFFSKYGELGLLGIIISAILTGLIIYVTLKIIKENNIRNYNELLQNINNKYKRINKILTIIVNSFLLISFYIMIAGFSAYINQTYNISIYISSIIFVTICYIIFKNSVKGVIKANEILVPALILLIIYLGIKNIPYLTNIRSNNLIGETTKGWLISSILYASYNSIILIPVLITIKDYINTKKDMKIISIISIIFITITSMLIYGLLIRGKFYVKDLELPLIEVTMEFGHIFKYIYGFVIIVSIFTSAISAGYSFLQNVCKTNKIYNIVLIIMCILGIAISKIGFSNLVEILYPLFGILGLFQIYMLFRKKVNNT